jgi:hypothetical protein
MTGDFEAPAQQDSLGLFFRELDVRVAALLERLSATPLPVPEPYREMRGTLAGEEVLMHTQLFTGQGFARIAWATMESVKTPARRPRAVTRTLIGFPNAGGPILGLDAVAMKERLGLFALDLAPTDLAVWADGPACAMLSARNALSEMSGFTFRARPEFASETFSEHAIMGYASQGSEHCCLDAVEFVFATLEREPKGPGLLAASSENAAKNLAKWIASERNNRKEFGALKRIFGDVMGRAYFEDFLFAPQWNQPSSEPIAVEPHTDRPR